ncbi:MAG: glutamate cyclase domain-containing protein [Candidatus Geothermarchaeales archaeon]
MKERILANYCDLADRVVTLDLRGRGVITKLYEAARGDGESLTLRTAKLIDKTVKKGDLFFITTGFPCYLVPAPQIPETKPAYVIQETDGPPGAAALARAIKMTYEATPVILTEERAVDITAKTCMGLGINVVDLGEAKKAKLAASVIPFPIDYDEAKEESKRLYDELNPSMVIAVEKVSPNVRGVYHTMSGYSVSDFAAKAGILMEDASSRGIPTIGVGDGGNEIGMGNIKEAVKKYAPNATKCKCPCGAGIAANTEVTELFAAFISNWGAYGIVAGLAALKEDPHIIHTGAMETRMVRACVDAGGIDGVTQFTYPSADGVDEEVNSWIPEVLRRSLVNYLEV